MPSLEERLTQKLGHRKKTNSFRQLHHLSEGIDFCSNDYLGLAKEPIVHEEISNSCKTSDIRLGATGSRLISGDSFIYQSVEEYLRKFHKGESALIFNSGYDANIGFFSTIPQRGDIILYDELCHTSIREGIRLSLAKGHSFLHNDLNALCSKLNQCSGNLFIAVESVYSMDGDIAPLKELAGLAEEFEAHLVVDEAHSTGIYGNHGEGLVALLGLEDKVFARLHTFGKAMGAHGAAWLGCQLMRDYLINYCRAFIYTTALPTYSVAHIQSAYNFLSNNPQRIEELKYNIQLFKKLVLENHIKGFILSDSPIQSCIIPGNKKVKEVTSLLQKKGFDVRPILHPTVSEGKERIRICIHTYNSHDEITQFVDTLKMGILQIS